MLHDRSLLGYFITLHYITLGLIIALIIALHSMALYKSSTLLYVLLKRNVFKFVLNSFREPLALTFSGRAFHNFGPVTLNDLSAKVFFLVKGTTSKFCFQTKQ